MIMIDLTGEKFGKLEVLYEVEPHITSAGKPLRKWKCRCDCGTEVEVLQANLISGNSNSCGCVRDEKRLARKRDLTGKRFGNLTVIGPSKEVYKSGKITIARKWLCLCDCGNEKVISQASLLRGLTKSCGHCKEGLAR